MTITCYIIQVVSSILYCCTSANEEILYKILFLTSILNKLFKQNFDFYRQKMELINNK